MMMSFLYSPFLTIPFHSILPNGTASVLTPDTLWQTWNWDIPVVITVMFSLWLYNRGILTLWRRLGFGRGVRYWQVAAFVAGILAIFVALVSPIEALSHSLFSAHMLQHMLLIAVAAPLLVTSGVETAFLAALPHRWQHELGRRWAKAKRITILWDYLSHPAVTWIIGVSVIWIWHVPALYQMALQNDFIHATEHLMFLLASMLFWWTLLKPSQQKYITYGAHVIYLFLATLQGTALGALLLFSGVPWYKAYSATAASWNLTPLQDQQLAGIIMWLPGGLLYMAGALLFFVFWFNALELRMRQPELAGGK